MEEFLVCPFSNKSLRKMSDNELTSLQFRVEENQMFFYSGAPVNIPIEEALITENHLYIYPVIDGIIYLQKQTAIVARNRIANPLRRTPKEEIDSFYQTYGFGKGTGTASVLEKKADKPIEEDKVKEFAYRLPKKGSCFLSVVTCNVDSIHNLAYGRDFTQRFHMDASLDSLRARQSDLPKDTTLVLGDVDSLPFKDDSIDALVSFDYLNNHEKEVQTSAYEELKRCLSKEGVSIMLYDSLKPLYAKNQLKADQLSKKALGMVAPWKRVKVPNIIFHPVGNTSSGSASNFVAKPSFGKQFS